MSDARSNTTIDDQQVRVTAWTFEARGDSTGFHTHEFDYIVVPVTGGTFSVTDAHGAVHRMEQNAGSPYRGAAGIEHTVSNAGDGRATFVEIELKF